MKNANFVHVTLIIVLSIVISGCYERNNKQVISKNDASFPIKEGINFYNVETGSYFANTLSKHLGDGLITNKQIEGLHKINFVPQLDKTITYKIINHYSTPHCPDQFT